MVKNQEPRSADAVAETDTDLFVLSRRKFDELSDRHQRLAGQLFAALARALAVRLRYANGELRALRGTTSHAASNPEREADASQQPRGSRRLLRQVFVR